MSGTLWIGMILLCIALQVELFKPQLIREGFATLVPATQTKSIIANLAPRRGDIGPTLDESGQEQDHRYFTDYADIQRYGFQNDFCRMIKPKGKSDEELFLACALAGTEGRSSISQRTETVKKGFKISRDDYMRDVFREGRDAQCRILKQGDGTQQPMCRRSQDLGFGPSDELDTEPPSEIRTLLDFLDGCVTWLRFRDDMVDYTNKLIVQTAGNPVLDETPRPIMTRGVHFNGVDQFIRFGDNQDLTLGNQVPMRSVRAFSLWVQIDEFTNNAHFFDFGNGAGVDNVFLGILGKGDAEGDGNTLRDIDPCLKDSTVPSRPSGQQKVQEVSPQEQLEGSKAQVDDFTCKGMEVFPRTLEPIETRPKPMEVQGKPKRATLLYEVWDGKLRKVQIKINKAIPLKRWTHIVITAKNEDALRPDLLVQVNGDPIQTQTPGALPQQKQTSFNYLGKSNWANATSSQELRDELFAGSMFDFRMQQTPLSQKKIDAIHRWGQGMLGLKGE